MFSLYRSAIIASVMCLLCSACHPSVEEVTAEDTQGILHPLTQPQKPVLLTYWSDWCAYCRAEVPFLNAVAAEGTVQVLGVFYEEVPVEHLVQLSKDFGITYPVLIASPEGGLALQKSGGLPAHYLIETQGRVRGPFLGEMTHEKLTSLLSSTIEK